ncbi:MAG: TlyA family RNA methyltransferase [Acidobacteria bacterium]|uniref:TlyA family RNA methyltransferase n=1 Tax=Candidatus Sulfomarinibacter kjeldsenii TaxID=2885994 RepID=A0A8J7CF04_9BACT|nr:TlyA family RNA methyltransferase [Candidatus Sulfomarinibacter kjeldsenii]MBD3871052.1 TlyA family RNA methyltransferase [Candidatus Sulfomarinibacter kjeldsenii]
MAKKQRLDVVVTDRGLVPSRARAQALILAGKVRLNGEVESKAGTQVDPEAMIEIIEPDHPWVSRGALKLVAALDEFEISPEGIDCLDVGASTGGFTDVLLARGARRVIALDVGRGQLDWRLRNDSRVVVLEGVNARHLDAETLPFTAALATVDVSFISLRLVVPSLLPHLAAEALLVCLVKPQFEAGRDQVGKGGIVRDEAVRRETVENTVRSLQGLGLELIGLVESPIRGQKGNLEELAVFRRLKPPVRGKE